jgi:hypothetical protein
MVDAMRGSGRAAVNASYRDGGVIHVRDALGKSAAYRRERSATSRSIHGRAVRLSR